MSDVAGYWHRQLAKVPPASEATAWKPDYAPVSPRQPEPETVKEVYWRLKAERLERDALHRHREMVAEDIGKPRDDFGQHGAPTYLWELFRDGRSEELSRELKRGAANAPFCFWLGKDA